MKEKNGILTREFIRSFRRGMRNLERQVELALQSQTECCAVTPAQCHLLLAVEEAGEPSVGELAAALELDASTLSRTADGLVKVGLLSRREDPANRRRQLVRLSDEGRRKTESIHELCDHYYAGLLSCLPEKAVAEIAAALPVFVEAMREWRAREGESACCGRKS